MGAGVRTDARSAVESLRYGTPPLNRALEFTVGREGQLEELQSTLEHDEPGALLLRANYGAGKTHLLRVIREAAMGVGYAVALVETDAAAGIRFNRMDTIFGAVSRAVEVPGRPTGIRGLFDAFLERHRAEGRLDPLLRQLSANGSWAPTGPLSPAVLIALRAYVVGSEPHREVASDWMSWPEAHRSRRKDLYLRLVDDLESRIAETRPEWQFYSDNVLTIHQDNHQGAWDGLASLNLVAQGAGMRGLILLFDEFEDVIQNLNNRTWQVAAFTNLFRFFSGDYPGMAYFAVTPDFTEQCKEELLWRGVYHFPLSEFDDLPAFELAPISLREFKILADRISETHREAHGYQRRVTLSSGVLRDLWGRPSPDRIRQAVQRLVGHLDRAAREGRGGS